MPAFERIVLRHQGTAWAVACRFLGDPAEAEDVAQEAFLRILKAAPGYRPTAKFQTFLYQVVSRLCLDRARKKRPIYVEKLPEAATESASPGEALEEQERRQWVRGALERLPPNQRLAVVLRYHEEMGYEEIGAAMEVSPKAAERLLARGRAALCDLLGAPEDGKAGGRGGFSRVARLIL